MCLEASSYLPSLASLVKRWMALVSIITADEAETGLVLDNKKMNARRIPWNRSVVPMNCILSFVAKTMLMAVLGLMVCGRERKNADTRRWISLLYHTIH